MVITDYYSFWVACDSVAVYGQRYPCVDVFKMAANVSSLAAKYRNAPTSGLRKNIGLVLGLSFSRAQICNICTSE